MTSETKVKAKTKAKGQAVTCAICRVDVPSGYNAHQHLTGRDHVKELGSTASAKR